MDNVIKESDMELGFEPGPDTFVFIDSSMYKDQAATIPGDLSISRGCRVT